MKISEIEGGVPTCVAIIVTICAIVLIAQQPPQKPATTPAKMGATIVLRRVYVLVNAPSAPVKLDSLAITRDKDLKAVLLQPHLRNTGTAGVIKFQLGYRITVNPAKGAVDRNDLPSMDVIGPVEEFHQAFLPSEDLSIYCHPLDESVFVSKYGDIPRTVAVFIASVTFVDGSTWTADAGKLPA